jgi:meiotic recombination protein SPO11
MGIHLLLSSLILYRAKIYGLVDADPHGLGILSVYTHGSHNNRHSKDHEGLAVGERMHWLGVKGTEWAK